MTVSDKIKHNSPFEINIYLEGAFWVACEQSAYRFHLTRGYKPTKKLVKCLGQEVVSVGFPKSALANAGVENFRPLSENANVQSFILETVIGLEKFREWKDALVVDCRDVSRYVSTPNPYNAHRCVGVCHSPVDACMVDVCCRDAARHVFTNRISYLLSTNI